MTDFVTVDFDYDANSNRTSMAASLIVEQMPVKDYKNTYAWDNLNRLGSVTQTSQSGARGKGDIVLFGGLHVAV